MAFELRVNGQTRVVDVEGDTPLLWVLRDELGLTGTKFGCGIAACGACTVHVDGAAARSCSLPVEAAVGADITTIEGLGTAEAPHPVQTAWIAEQVPQCGYCQTGAIMAVAALLARNPRPDAALIAAEIDNICRCGTYPAMAKAIARAVAEGAQGGGSIPLQTRNERDEGANTDA